MGIPSIITSIAKNQDESYDRYTKDNLAIPFDISTLQKQAHHIAEKIQALLEDYNQLKQNCLEVYDDQGLVRITSELNWITLK